MRLACVGEITGPICVSCSSGSPTRILPRLAHELAQELVVDVLMQEEPGAGRAALTGVGEDGEEGTVDRLVEIGVREDDVRALAAELEGDLLDRSRRKLQDAPPGRRLAGEGDLVDAGMSGERLADLLAGTGEDVHHAIGDARFATDLAQHHRGDRGGAGRFEDEGVAGGEGWGQLPGGHQQREIPGHDLGADADRLAQGVVEQRAVHRDLLAPELRGEPGVVLEAVGGGGDVAARLDDDLAAVGRLDDRRSRAAARAGCAAIRCMMRDRSSGVMRGHGPSSNARRAAATARSTSSTPALAMRPTGSFVVGLTVSNVSPLAAGTFSPPMIRS